MWSGADTFEAKLWESGLPTLPTPQRSRTSSGAETIEEKLCLWESSLPTLGNSRGPKERGLAWSGAETIEAKLW
jgi:hypothetical protein